MGYGGAMFTAKVYSTFAAAHRLREYQGDCENLHGHNYRVEVAVRAEELDRLGLVMDFREIKRLLKGMMDGLDHTYLNELPAFAEINPSAENIARHIYETLETQLTAPARMAAVTVWENDTSCVTFEK